MLDPYATEEDSVKPKFEAMGAEFQLWSDMALCISWQLTQNLAQGSACKRLAEMGSSHSWQIPYVPSLTRISASSTSRSRLFSRLLRLRNSHSSWLCWLRSPESDGSSRRDTKAAAFSADIRRRSSFAFSRNARTLRSTL